MLAYFLHIKDYPNPVRKILTGFIRNKSFRLLFGHNVHWMDENGKTTIDKLR